MRASPLRNTRWLLFSDLHFKRQDLDRVRQTADWIVATAKHHRVSRAIVCGDLLHHRSEQPAPVLSACYHFVGQLSEVVPRVHVILGNHDLAYRHQYHTTALEALNISRLAPHVTLHSAVERHSWDGRKVLLLPFREDQTVLTEAVEELDPREAGETVAFAHLAINKAITQRYVVRNGVKKLRVLKPVTYQGFTGPERFARLARTFTGHFHSPQTMYQASEDGRQDLEGSVTYLGSPLQLSWADLYDDQRGAVLLDPDTLQHETLVNPFAVNYTTADAQQVLQGQMETFEVAGKHVMLMGELDHLKYLRARDELLTLGARSVKEWDFPSLSVPTSQISSGTLGSSIPSSDIPAQPPRKPAESLRNDHLSETQPAPTTATDVVELDCVAEAQQYVESSVSDGLLMSRRDELFRVGRRILQTGQESTWSDDFNVSYKDFLDGPEQIEQRVRSTSSAQSASDVFLAEPRVLKITNFLSVQDTVELDFQQDIPSGLTFLVGENGSGKSTVMEAIVWCQFGKCIRSGMKVNDVINDKIGKDCSVTLEFANGYTISRYRKHKEFQNRIIISRHGEWLAEMEHASTEKTQEAIDELLGIDYETYIKTFVLSHENASSFFNLSAAQRRDLIESSLGLSVLDRSEKIAKWIVKDLDKSIHEVQGKMDLLLERVDATGDDIMATEKNVGELQVAIARLLYSQQDAVQRASDLRDRLHHQEEVFFDQCLPELDGAESKERKENHSELVTSESEIERLLQRSVHLMESVEGYDAQIMSLKEQVRLERGSLSELGSLIAQVHTADGSGRTVSSRLSQYVSHLLRRIITSIPAVVRNPILRLWSFLISAVPGLARGVREDAPGGPRPRNRERGNILDGLTQQIEKRNIRLANLAEEATRMTEARATVVDQLATLRSSIVNVLSRAVECVTDSTETLERSTGRVISSTATALAHAEALRALRTDTRNAVHNLKATEHQLIMKRLEITMLQSQISKMSSDLESFESRYAVQGSQLGELSADRELLTFWSSALSKRTRQSPISAHAKSTVRDGANFRENARSKALASLESILAQVLILLYDDTRHAKYLASGMLRSIFDSETTVESNMAAMSSGSLLDRTLAVRSSLGYGKRSGGERRRFDLGLFFALLQIANAQSAYRGSYLLVDEAFDRLDVAGQTAVVRWCGLLSQSTTPWVVVITHSPVLLRQDVDSNAGKASIITARMGNAGTDFSPEFSAEAEQDGDEAESGMATPA